MSPPPAAADVHELFDAVRNHPDFVFGTIFVTADFPGGTVPEDFQARRGTDALAAAGTEFIEQACGELSEDEWDGADSAPGVFALMDRVREHPDFAFGTFFVAADFPGGLVPDRFPARRGTDALCDAGSEFIEQTCGPHERED